VGMCMDFQKEVYLLENVKKHIVNMFFESVLMYDQYEW